MKLTIFTDNNQVGKTQKDGETKHPIKGVIHNKEFNSVEGLAALISDLSAHEFIVPGIYPDNYKYTSAKDAQGLSQPRTITRGKANATPGHILCIDCDHESFASLRGKGLHDFLVKQLPDIFSGAGYVTTSSTSYYTKDKEKFHQYYVFKTPSDMSSLVTLIDRIFKQHNMITTGLASNYSRSYIYTPIDTKLKELQQPIFEMSTQRLKTLGIDKPLRIETQPGSIIEVSALSLPNPALPDVLDNVNRHREQAEQIRAAKYATYVQEHGLPAARGSSLEKGILPPDMEVIAHTNEKVPLHKTTLMEIISELIQNNKVPPELFQAIGEPEYAPHQTAKLFTGENPFQLSQWRMYDHAHGGINYIPVFSYEQIYQLLELAKPIVTNPRNFMWLATANSNMGMEEIQIIAKMYAKSAGVTPGSLATFLTNAANHDAQVLEEAIESISDEDLGTLLASIEGSKQIAYTPKQRNLMKTAELANKQVLFRVENLNILREIVARIDNEIVTKPGPLNNFNIASRAHTVKNLAQVYPLTHISSKANEITMDAMIQKFTTERNLDTVIYKSSLHGEKLLFSDNKMEITYQQAPPSFARVPDNVRVTLDSISASHESEIRDIYMNESIGDIWGYIAELMYIKKVYPALKKDFLWLNFASDVGKTYNMDIADLITPSVTSTLDQLLQQASKIRPTDLVKASYIRHDEVKHFSHSWNDLGAMYSVKGMHSNAISTQLPLKILMSAEDTLSKGTKQQMNRLMIYKSTATKPFKDLVPETEWAAFSAVTHQVIYEKFIEAYKKYSRLPQNEAVQLAIVESHKISALLTPKDMMVTEDVVKEAITGYLLQEYVNSDLPDERLTRYIKNDVVKDGTLYINFKKIDAPKFIEYVLGATTSSLETRAMNYEALSITWADIGAYNLEAQKTIGGTSGFYGQVLELDIPQGLR